MQTVASQVRGIKWKLTCQTNWNEGELRVNTFKQTRTKLGMVLRTRASGADTSRQMRLWVCAAALLKKSWMFTAATASFWVIFFPFWSWLIIHSHVWLDKLNPDPEHFLFHQNYPQNLADAHLLLLQLVLGSNSSLVFKVRLCVTWPSRDSSKWFL